MTVCIPEVLKISGIMTSQSPNTNQVASTPPKRSSGRDVSPSGDPSDKTVSPTKIIRTCRVARSTQGNDTLNTIDFFEDFSFSV